MNNQEFTEEQKLYLQGFMSGSSVARTAQGLPDLSAVLGRALAPSAPAAAPVSAPATPASAPAEHPDAQALAAQDRVIASGQKLTEQEAAKRAKHPLDQWDDIVLHSKEARFPKGTDALAFKYHGLFHVAPTQNSYMSRLRFPCGIVRSDQLRCVAHVAQELAGGYAHITTRANLQIREVKAEHGTAILDMFHEHGIVNRGSGADNIRNVTGSPAAGIDPHELIDTRALCKEMNSYILNNRDMYGLPRKFNISFDGGGRIAALEDTNDIGFQAVQVLEGKSVEPGIYFRLALGGITGHQDFARDTGFMFKAEECVPVAAAIVRVFIDEGDRTDRKKARLKYVLDRLGFEAFMEKVQAFVPFELRRFALSECEPRPEIDRVAHVGVHAQKQEGLFYIGVITPVGKLEPEQMRGLASLCDRYGSGSLRLTAWQSIVLPDIREADLEEVKSQLEAMGLFWKASQVRANLIACTGNFGCKFALAATKKTALEIADYVESKLELDTPLNVHVTGCPNSCAQHYIGDVGLMGVKVEVGDDMLDGYHIFVGGGFGKDAAIGRLVAPDVVAEDAPQVVENMLAAFMERRNAGETFVQWTKRHSDDELKSFFEAQREAQAVAV
jgi:ferredoxin-nitrite reductase